MLLSPPRPDEFEVSVFGPGVGECVVVHLGGGQWAVVDSCIDSKTGRPACLGYFDQIGVHAATAVKLVVVTHWHDDHIRGASQVLQEATGARFVCSAALQSQDFLKLVVANEKLMLKRGGAGTEEFLAILRIIASRRPQGTRPTAVGPDWALAGTTIYYRAGGQSAPACEVRALSPSSASMTRSLHSIAGLLPVAREAKRAAVSVSPNETSLVLSVNFGDLGVLLGADLETTGNPLCGWEAVVRDYDGRTGAAHVFKVPHHGSKTAHHDDVWSRLLVREPWAVLTPFLSSALPRPEDIKRIRKRSLAAYCAGPERAPKPRLSTPVERAASDVARRLRKRAGGMGHVRMRAIAGDAWQVSLFGSAHELDAG